MPTTSNFGWNTPADTDLVKDGALAIRTLGNNIDASLVDLKGGTTGQVLSKASNSDLDYTWVTTDDANAIQNAIVDARGDLIAASANDTPARLAVGNNGETLVADSTTTTGLRWQGSYPAGRNKILNGDFAINQRQFTSVNTDGTYGFDRWSLALSGATATYTPQTFTAGAAPVVGYEATNFARVTVTTGNDFCRLEQRIEDVRTFANQTVTLSFWAKGTNPTTDGKLYANLVQNFGTGGSANVLTTAQSFVLTANWTRYSFIFNVPSISGKTIGTNSLLLVRLGQEASVSTDAWTLDVWGVQLEAGSVATPFQTATGNPASELAACQRYYFRGIYGLNTRIGSGYNVSTTAANYVIHFPVTMRISPTALEQSGTATDYAIQHGNYTITNLNAVPTFVQGSPVSGSVQMTVASGLTAGQGSIAFANNANAYFGWSAEL